MGEGVVLSIPGNRVLLECLVLKRIWGSFRWKLPSRGVRICLFRVFIIITLIMRTSPTALILCPLVVSRYKVLYLAYVPNIAPSLTLTKPDSFESRTPYDRPVISQTLQLCVAILRTLISKTEHHRCRWKRNALLVMRHPGTGGAAARTCCVSQGGREDVGRHRLHFLFCNSTTSQREATNILP